MKPIKKIQAIGSRLEVYPGELHILRGTIFKKTTIIPVSDIKNVSALFDYLKIDTRNHGKFSLWFGNDNMAAFMAVKALNGALKDAAL